MKHPLKCLECDEYRFIEYSRVRFEDGEQKKGFGIEIPFFKCVTCSKLELVLPQEPFDTFKEDLLPEIRDGEFFEMPLNYIYPKIDSEKKFEQFSHLELDYDARDYYLIPGLYRDEDDGYQTPVFFDKDILLYYNNHHNYSVKLTSFSSGNIFYKGNPMFSWGFGINRSGKIFKWLGDLNEDFEDDSRKNDLKRFQASNVASDHDVASKFYLRQNPFSVEDAFIRSDNEMGLFRLTNEFSAWISKEHGFDLTKMNVIELAEYYKPPILEERDQIFSAYLSLNKYLIENLQEKAIRSALLEHGLQEDDLKSNGRKLGSLKLFTLFIEKVLKQKDANDLVSPLYVLNDLRQLHGHLSNDSFEKRYSSCKERLGLADDVSDLEVFNLLVTSMVAFYQNILPSAQSNDYPAIAT